MTTAHLRAESDAVKNEAGGELTTRAAMLEGAADEIERDQYCIFELLAAAEPFVQVVRNSSGNIPTERLSFADWDRLSRAFSGAAMAREGLSPPMCPKCQWGRMVLADGKQHYHDIKHPHWRCEIWIGSGVCGRTMPILCPF